VTVQPAWPQSGRGQRAAGCRRWFLAVTGLHIALMAMCTVLYPPVTVAAALAARRPARSAPPEAAPARPGDAAAEPPARVPSVAAPRLTVQARPEG